ncbi:membrane-targeted effector domain-containing toxin [Pseudomonas sp. MDT1-17]
MTSTENRPLPNAADKATLKAIANPVVLNCPSLQDTAHEVAKDVLNKHGLVDLDPDHVYYHRFKTAQSNSRSFTGWEHTFEKPYESLTLTQLMIHRFRVTDQDNADLLDLYGGFYSAGPETDIFDERNEVRLHGNEVLEDFWTISFSDYYRNKLRTFWADYSDDFRSLAKCNFLANAVEARDSGQLSNADFQSAIAAVIGPLSWPISLQTLRTEASSDAGLRVCTLDVAGHVATDILRIVDRNGRQILYLPGEAQAFQVLETPTDMHWWVLGQMNDSTNLQAFLNHFPLADRQAINQNITDLMNRLVSTWGHGDHHLINQKDQRVTGDAFTWLRNAVRDAMDAEADLSLTSNGDLRKGLWIGYLSAGVKIFGPMAMIGWPVALLVIGASLANMGLNIDQAVNGKTSSERKAGVIGAIFSAIDALFNLPFLRGAGSLAEAGGEVDELIDTVSSAESLPESENTGETEAAGVLVEKVPSVPESGQRPQVPDTWQTNELLEGETPTREAGKFQGIYQLPSNPSTAIMMNDTAYYVRYENDVNGSGHWAIINPENPHAFSESIPVRLNEEGHWETVPRNGLMGGGKPVGTGSPPPRLSSYEVPLQLREELSNAAQGSEDRALMDVFDSLKEGDPYREFKAIRKRLYQDASRFYEAPQLPTRPPMPELAPASDGKTIIHSVLEDARGLVVGESHSEIGSKQFLIDNMETLARRNVKTLYMEHLLTDFHQVDLDSFFDNKVMPASLEKYLEGLDAGHITDPLKRYTFLELVKAANKNGVRVQAIDCMASYRVNGMRFAPGEFHAGSTARQKMMNFYSREVIRADQAARGTHKWVALMGNSHANTFEGVAGVSEMEEAIGIRIEDVAEGTSKGIEVDPGRTLSDGNIDSSSSLVKSDFVLQVEIPWAAKSLPEIESLLSRPGMYTLKQELRHLFLVHRSKDHSIVRTLIEESGGRFYIERPSWVSMNKQRFNSIPALLKGLDRMGLKLAGWSKPLL